MYNIISKAGHRLGRWLGLALLTASAFVVGACSDDFNINADVEIPSGSSLEKVLESYDHTIEIEVKTDSEWEIQFDQDGDEIAYAYPNKGVGNAKVKICVMANIDDVRRSGVMTIHFPKDKSRDKVFKLEQKARSESDENYSEAMIGSQSYAIGFGYYGANGMTPGTSVKSRILKAEALKEAGQVSKAAGSKFQLVAHTYTGSTVAELSNDFTATADFEGGACGFNAEINASFNMKDFSNEQYEYAMTYIDVQEERITITSSYGEWDAEDMITEAAYRAINNDYDDPKCRRKNLFPSNDAGFKKLVEAYGTHVIVSATLGGRLRSSTTIDVSKVTKEYDLHAFAKMSYDGIVSASASVDESYKASYEQNKQACRTQLTAWGGDTDLATAVTFARGEEETNAAVRAWIEDINKNQDSWDYIGPATKEDLVPIWELVVDDERREALQKYIEEKRYLDKETSYDLGIVAHLDDLDALDAELNDPGYKGSLMREINIGSDGNKTVAMMCSEFIPDIDKKRRVLVFYPVMNGVVKWNMGYFPGNEFAKPAKVSNYGGNVKVMTKSDMNVGCPSELYLRGAYIQSEPCDSETEELKASSYPYMLATYKLDSSEGGNATERGSKIGEYALVKVFNNIWMRENFSGTRMPRTGAYIPQSYSFSELSNTMPTYVCLQDRDAMLYLTRLIHGDKELPPTGWTYLNVDNMEKITEALNRYNLPLSGSFLPGGVIGTDVEFDGRGVSYIYHNTVQYTKAGFQQGVAAYIYALPSIFNMYDQPAYYFDESSIRFHNISGTSHGGYYSAYDLPYYSVRFVYPIE